MNIHEYQAKNILKSHGVIVQEGIAVSTAADAIKAAKQLTESTGTTSWIIKAQVHAGGRGKGGGVKLARTLEEVETIASRMIGMNLVTPQTGARGKIVSTVLVAQDVYYPGDPDQLEFYVSVVVNRQTGKNSIIYSPDGGGDIEEVAATNPHRVFREEVNMPNGLLPFQYRRVVTNLGLEGQVAAEMIKFLENLYKAYLWVDATMIEINPVLKTTGNKIVAVDAKVIIDDNALYRQPEIAALRDVQQEEPSEVEAAENNLSFVKLDGNIGCMVNGAGLAMATMDIIKISGGEPANFLDIGGTANARTVEIGLKIILSDSNVKAVLINIFGGIVRCDRVASGIVKAYHNMGNIKVPVIVRLQGTNAVEGKRVIDNSGLKVYSAITLQEAADLVKKIV